MYRRFKKNPMIEQLRQTVILSTIHLNTINVMSTQMKRRHQGGALRRLQPHEAELGFLPVSLSGRGRLHVVRLSTSSWLAQGRNV